MEGIASNRKAVSPFIEMVFTILFGVTMLAIILNTVNPLFSRATDTSAVNDAFQNLELLRSAVESVASEAQGSTRTVPLSVSGGTYRADATYDWLYFEYNPQEALQLFGQRGNVLVRQGLQFADWFDSYATGSESSAGWTNTSGTWSFMDYKYLGTNGTSYHNVSGPLTNWKFSASISNVSGATGGQVFALPTNPESLVGFWSFDEYTGTNAYDYSGNNNTGTLTNMNTTGNATSGWNSTDCRFGNCLKFDGKNDYVNATNSPSLQVTGGLTISMWIYVNSLSSNMVPLDKHWAGEYFLKIMTDGRLDFAHGAPGNQEELAILPVGSVTAGSWLNIVAVRSTSATTLTGYKNGVASAPVTYAKTPSVSTQNVIIGMEDGLYNPFNGTIDEVMIFNRSLSADEVAALYETSAKKLSGAGGTQSIIMKTPNPAIVLANPAGQTRFDNIEATDGTNRLTFVVPFSDADINGTMRAGKGDHTIEVRNMGVNAASGRPVVQLTAS